MPSPAIRGDVNADGEFTVSDLTFLKGYIQGVATLTKKAFQKREMDPRFSGYSFSGSSVPDTGDVGFILNALAKKKRFLVAPPSIAVENCVMTVRIRLTHIVVQDLMVQNVVVLQIVIQLSMRVPPDPHVPISVLQMKL